MVSLEEPLAATAFPLFYDNPWVEGDGPPGPGTQLHIGDFDGDGADDLFWYGPGPLEDAIWYGGQTR